MSIKNEQLAGAIDKALREVLVRGFHDPRIAGLITVTEVRVTQDGKHAHVGISVLPAEKASLSLHGLQSAAAFVRREVGDMIRVRSMPDFVFRLDDSLKKQARVLAALDKAREELAAQPVPREVDPPPPSVPPTVPPPE
jgi:ribosome-binding factor A